MFVAVLLILPNVSSEESTINSYIADARVTVAHRSVCSFNIMNTTRHECKKTFARASPSPAIQYGIPQARPIFNLFSSSMRNIAPHTWGCGIKYATEVNVGTTTNIEHVPNEQPCNSA